jgi:hypothetical protein
MHRIMVCGSLLTRPPSVRRRPCVRNAARTAGSLLFGVYALACAPDQAREDVRLPSLEPHAELEPTDTDVPEHGAQLPQRAASISDTLLLEGMPEVTLFRLFRSPEEATVRFSTYVPDGVHAAMEGAADTLAVRFSAAFTGMPHASAYMQVRFYPFDATNRNVLAAMSELLRRRAPAGEELRAADTPAWATEAYTFTYRGDGNVLYVGRAVIALHAGRRFHVFTHYPAEFGDGLGPRFARILDDWRWEDTGAMLTRG